MDETQINAFVAMLESDKTVEFTYNGFYHEIFESADSGYVVNVYSDDEKDEEGEYLDRFLVDGGLCSGTARDAIGFML